MVRCNKYNPLQWQCMGCAHAKWHEPVSIRKSTSVELPCHEHGDYCISTNQRVKCEGVLYE